MNMIASATVIRGKGGCEAYMNGILNQEMKRLNDQHAAEVQMLTQQRNRLLADRMQAMKPVQREGLLKRLKNRLETAWAIFFALLLHWGVIVPIGDEEL